MRLIGVVQNLPGVCTFMRPIFADGAGEICLQKIENGIIRDWEFYRRDATIVPIDFQVWRERDDVALVCCEYKPGHILIGDLPAFAQQLRQGPFLTETFKARSPASYETYQEFLAYAAGLSLPQKKWDWFEERMIDLSATGASPTAAVTSRALRVRLAGPKPLRRLGPGRFGTLLVSDDRSYRNSSDVESIVDIARTRYFNQLLREAALLLDRPIAAQNLVTQVFELWAKHLYSAPPPADFLFSIRAIFRPSLFQELVLIKHPKKTTRAIRGRHESMKRALHRADRGFGRLQWSSNELRKDDYHLKKFKAFQALSPEAACMVFWACQDCLSLDEMCQATSMNPDEVLQLLNKWQPDLRHLLNPRGTRIGTYFRPPGDNEDHLDWKETSFPLGSRGSVRPGSLASADEKQGDLNFMWRLIDGTRRAAGLDESVSTETTGNDILLANLLAYDHSKDIH